MPGPKRRSRTCCISIHFIIQKRKWKNYDLTRIFYRMSLIFNVWKIICRDLKTKRFKKEWDYLKVLIAYDATGIDKKFLSPGNKRECLISKIYAERIHPVFNSGLPFHYSVYKKNSFYWGDKFKACIKNRSFFLSQVNRNPKSLFKILCKCL